MHLQSTGAEQSFIVPAGATRITVEAIGASGGGNARGADVIAPLTVTPGSTLYVEVGGSGAVGGTTGTSGPGGFNGGGDGGPGNAGLNGGGGGGGGGASDIRSGPRSSANTLATRLIVAAGGGGGAYGLPFPGGTYSQAGGSGDQGVTGPLPVGATGGGGGSGGSALAGGTGGSAGTAGIAGKGGIAGVAGGIGTIGSGGTGGDGSCSGNPGAGGGGGGGGLYGGGGGGGACNSAGGGGGGAGSALIPAGGSGTAAASAGSGSVVITYAHVVGTGTSASCTKAALDAAVAAGGLVTFNCGGSPVTIVDNLTITQNTTLDGTGQQVTLDGNQQGTVVTVSGGVTVTVTALTITGGQVGATTGGGGILNQGTLTVSNSNISGNVATFAGGGIANEVGGTLTVSNSNISGNASGDTITIGRGGGINNGGTLTVMSSTISGNTSGVTTRPGNGGGIYNSGTVTLSESTVSGNTVPGSTGDGGGIGNAGTLTVISSTISGNKVGNTGGGIYNVSGKVTLTSSTVSGNTASGNGGGGMSTFGTGTVTVTNSTVSGNSAGLGGGILSNYGTLTVTNSTVSGNSGGGIESDVGSTATLISSIVAGNTASSGAADCRGTLTSGGHNLIGDSSGCTYIGDPTDQVGTGAGPIDPKLSALQNNGGPTYTQALLYGSPAIDAVPAANCTLTTDQAGQPRPDSSEAAPDAGTCDIGAYEFQDPAVTAAAVTLSNLSQMYDGTPKSAGADISPTTCGPVTLSYSQNGTPVSAPTSAGSYSVHASLGNSSCTIGSGGTGTLIIGQASQTITFTALPNHTYGDPPFTVSATADSGLPVSFAVGATDTCTIAGNSVTITGAGSCTVTASQTGNTNYLAAAAVVQTFSIAQAGLTITPDNQNMTYGGAVPAFTVSPGGYIGLVHGDQPSVVGGLSCGATDSHSRPGNSTTPAGTYTITCTGGAATNYSITYKTGTLTIGQAGLIVTANGQSKTYGSTLTFAGTEFTTSGLVNGDTVTSVTLTSAGAAPSAGVSGSPYAIVPSAAIGSGLGNYTITYTNGSLTVNPKALTVTASSTTVTYGDAAPTIMATYSGFITGDNAGNSLSPAPTCSTTYTQGSGVGSYPTSCSGAVSTNYTLSYVNGGVKVSQAPQTITFTAPANKVLGSAPFTVSATGGASGNPVTFTASPSTVCTASGTNGTTIALVGVGTCTVTATQAGNTNYQAASPVTQSFSVAYPPLYLVLGLTSSPAGTVTTGSAVTAKMTLGNHTTATQTVTLNVTLRYTGSHGSYSLTVPLTFKLNTEQTVSQAMSFTITRLFPRGSYVLSATATDKSGDTASSSATLTVS